MARKTRSGWAVVRVSVVTLVVVLLALGLGARLLLNPSPDAYGASLPIEAHDAAVYEGSNAWRALLTDAFNDMRAEAAEQGLVRSLLQDVLGLLEGEGTGEGEGWREGATEGEGEGLGRQVCRIYLTGSQVVAPTDSEALGWADLTYRPNTAELTLNLIHTIERPTGVFLCAGEIGENGPVLLDLGEARSPVRVSLHAQDVATLLRHESHYLLVTSKVYPDGEIRGDGYCDAPYLSSFQLPAPTPSKPGPVATTQTRSAEGEGEGEGEGQPTEEVFFPLCSFDFTQEQVDPDTGSLATADARIYMDLPTGRLFLSIESHDVANAQELLLYEGLSGDGGPLVGNLGSAAAPVFVELPELDLQNAPEDMYIALTSTQFPSGEIVGHLPTSCMKGNQDLQLCYTELTGTGVNPPACSGEYAAGYLFVNNAEMVVAIALFDISVSGATDLVLRDAADPNTPEVYLDNLTGVTAPYISVLSDEQLVGAASMSRPSVVIKSTSHPNGSVGALLGCTAKAAFADPFYVDINSTADPADGKSWGTAFTSIQTAVDAAASIGGGEVWVAEGVYAEVQGNTPCLTALNLDSNVHVFGGFQSGDSSQDQRDWHKQPSIISGWRPDGGQQAEHVVRANHVWNTTLDGFVLVGGLAGGLCDEAAGGSIYATDTYDGIRFQNLTIVLNTASQLSDPSSLAHGAGVYVDAAGQDPGESIVSFQDCRIIGNTVYGLGGAVYIGTNVDASFENVLIAGNEARATISEPSSPGYGAGLYISEMDAGISHFIMSTTLAGNMADFGGGIYAATVPSMETMCGVTIPWPASPTPKGTRVSSMPSSARRTTTAGMQRTIARCYATAKRTPRPLRQQTRLVVFSSSRTASICSKAGLFMALSMTTMPCHGNSMSSPTA